MLEKLAEKEVEAAQKSRSMLYKVVVTVAGILIFLVVLPGLLYLAGKWADERFLKDLTRQIEQGFGLVCIAVGLLFLLWAALTQMIVGKGTPAPMAPTEKLVVRGPFRLCRNPIQFGAMLYYLGIGTFLASIKVGATMFVLVLVFASLYHKLIEEKELEMRFGEEYRQYRSKTPFLVPKIWD